MQGWGEEGEGEMSEGSSMDASHQHMQIDSQWELAVGLRELQQGPWNNLGGGKRREVGGRFKREGTNVNLH